MRLYEHKKDIKQQKIESSTKAKHCWEYDHVLITTKQNFGKKDSKTGNIIIVFNQNHPVNKDEDHEWTNLVNGFKGYNNNRRVST